MLLRWSYLAIYFKYGDILFKTQRYFAEEQYFDSNGLFISVVFSGPMILNCTLIVSIWLYQSFSLIIQVIKIRKTLKKRRDEKNKSSLKTNESETKKEKWYESTL